LKNLTANRINAASLRSDSFFLFVLVHVGLWLIILLSVISCARKSNETTQTAPPVQVTLQGALPAAVLYTGEYPLWFQLTEDGPAHIESIEDAVFTSAFNPWPYALHVRFLHEREDGLVMAINRGGFLKIAPNDNSALQTEQPTLVMYYFSGGRLWRQYTTGGFVFYNEKPAALLYLDSRFMDTDAPSPSPNVWSFNMESNNIFPIQIPVMRFFPEEDGWSADTLRMGSDGLIYYRAANRRMEPPSVRMFRTDNLDQMGSEITAEVFFSSVPRVKDFSHFSLPDLPEGFFYTESGFTGDSLFAAWEEQQDYSIGAAGFMLVKR